MKVIFLDVDGVLNHHDSPGWDVTHRVVDQNCLMQLKRIIRETDAKIVVSSTWRYALDTMQELTYNLKSANISVIGQTPLINLMNRQSEIKSWLSSNEHFGIVKIAILDDESDADTKEGDFFQTSFESGGLTEEIADRVIEHLK